MNQVKNTSLRKRVALGMSGGVDSSLSAHLLKEQGYDVTGVFLECWRAPGCRTDEDRKDALAVALSLEIPFQVLDFKQTYKDRVVEYFFNEYEAGRTPNPDVMCNKEIKFGLFYEWAMKEGFDYVATGHYAKVEQVELPNGKRAPSLCVPADTWKDQTYFLHLLTEEQLTHIVFPLGDLSKNEVRIQAKQRGITVANKPDSVGICFIGDINVHDFLRERLGENPGDVVDTHGTVIGKHKGLWFYTIGQRHGFTINPTTSLKNDDGTVVERTNLPPFYVIEKSGETNQLVVGFGNETKKDEFVVAHMHRIHDIELQDLKKLTVRIRHTGQLLDCRVEENGETFRVKLEVPVQGIAEGQSAVFYTEIGKEMVCLGGGTIAA